nr:hypothetical protein [Clostridium sp. 19966]
MDGNNENPREICCNPNPILVNITAYIVLFKLSRKIFNSNPLHITSSNIALSKENNIVNKIKELVKQGLCINTNGIKMHILINTACTKK